MRSACVRGAALAALVGIPLAGRGGWAGELWSRPLGAHEVAVGEDDVGGVAVGEVAGDGAPALAARSARPARSDPEVVEIAHTVRVAAADDHATLTVRRTLANRGHRPVELLLELDRPRGASVRSLRVRAQGGPWRAARLRPADRARAEYEGRTGLAVAPDDARLLGETLLRLGPVAAGAAVTVEVGMIVAVRRAEGVGLVEYPLPAPPAMAPRFEGGGRVTIVDARAEIEVATAPVGATRARLGSFALGPERRLVAVQVDAPDRIPEAADARVVLVLGRPRDEGQRGAQVGVARELARRRPRASFQEVRMGPGEPAGAGEPAGPRGASAAAPEATEPGATPIEATGLDAVDPEVPPPEAAAAASSLETALAAAAAAAGEAGEAGAAGEGAPGRGPRRIVLIVDGRDLGLGLGAAARGAIPAALARAPVGTLLDVVTLSRADRRAGSSCVVFEPPFSPFARMTGEGDGRFVAASGACAEADAGTIVDALLRRRLAQIRFVAPAVPETVVAENCPTLPLDEGARGYFMGLADGPPVRLALEALAGATPVRAAVAPDARLSRLLPALIFGMAETCESGACLGTDGLSEDDRRALAVAGGVATPLTSFVSGGAGSAPAALLRVAAPGPAAEDE